MTYLSLFLSAFLAATLLPAFSEIALATFVAQGFDPIYLWLVATSGNTLGAIVNWILGRFCRCFENSSWFPISAASINKADTVFQRYGVWSLLFAWLPIVGDPLTFIAGATRIGFWKFFILVGLGKGLRYAVVLAVALKIF